MLFPRNISAAKCFTSKRTAAAQFRVTLIPGDGTGPERIRSMCQVAKVAKLPIEWQIMQLSEQDSFSSAPIEQVLTSIKTNKLCIKGPIVSVESSDGTVPLNIKLRRTLDTYFSLNHFKTLSPNIPAHFKNIDIVLVRESTEGEYSNVEHEVVPGVVENLKVVSRDKSRRIALKAMEYALAHERKKIAVVHKANIMKKTDGLFLQTVLDIQKENVKFKNLEIKALIVDNCAMQLLTNPDQFDMILTSNFYGNIIANILAGISGGPALTAGTLKSDEVSIFECAVRKSYSEASGRNIANPIAEIRALMLLLEEVGMRKQSDLLNNALLNCLDKHKECYTQDIGGKATTSDFMKIYLSQVENYFQ